MPEQEEAIREKPDLLNKSFILYIAIAYSVKEVLERATNLPMEVALALGFLCAGIADYWIKHKKESFALCMKRGLLLASMIFLGFWLFPVLLSRWVWAPLNYGVCVFVTLMTLNWSMSLVTNKPTPLLTPEVRRKNFRALLLFGLIMGVLMGVATYFTLPKE